jgi:hypothetical protein
MERSKELDCSHAEENCGDRQAGSPGWRWVTLDVLCSVESTNHAATVKVILPGLNQQPGIGKPGGGRNTVGLAATAAWTEV